jgi:putative transposase
VTAERRSLFQVTATAELLEQTILDYHSQGKFLLHAFVIMPDHFHALITPAPEVSLEKAMQFIKGGFSFRLKIKHDVWMRRRVATVPRLFQTKLRVPPVAFGDRR